MEKLLTALAFGSFFLAPPALKSSSDAPILPPLGKASVYYSAPAENLDVIPTQESLDYTGLHFPHMARIVRFQFEAYPQQKRFQNIKTIVLDYGVKPPEKVPPSASQNPDAVVDTNWWFPKPQRYFLALKFYTTDPKNLKTPSFQITTLLPVKTSMGATEAFLFMVNEAFDELQNHLNENNILLDLG
ncbi:hypothetical protein Bealeia1_00691 [Candidatus Bealeia paramacronuclearis]|uniref:ABC-type transport auxiliary lipoprotein component domain-containing protein n=1 Tax=Candidatus Bealeia paramacronuclearis TaxID=1921001 RepID=A0ABZ2C4Y7_9PROT|nr:hypothetical protein [Candidatus Bealeia paramacronuclearis]